MVRLPSSMQANSTELQYVHGRLSGGGGRETQVSRKPHFSSQWQEIELGLRNLGEGERVVGGWWVDGGGFSALSSLCILLLFG